jgi:hypothetical protein
MRRHTSLGAAAWAEAAMPVPDKPQHLTETRPPKTALDALRQLPSTLRRMSREEILEIGVKAGIYKPDGSLTDAFRGTPADAGSSRGQK